MNDFNFITIHKRKSQIKLDKIKKMLQTNFLSNDIYNLKTKIKMSFEQLNNSYYQSYVKKIIAIFKTIT